MIDELRMFVAVVDAGSLSKAARLKGVAVSSVTRRIDQLELGLGVKLLRRSSRALMLTDAGEQFIVSARNILTELDEATAALSDSQTNLGGTLSITAPASFGRRHVVPATMSFMKLYPQIEIELHLSDDIVDLFANRVDVAIRTGVLPDSDLIATRITPVHRIACASPAYFAQHGRPKVPADLLKHNCLTVASLPVPAGWWTFSDTKKSAVAVKNKPSAKVTTKNTSLAVNGNFRSDDTEALLNLAVAGMGVVHLASWLVGDKIATGELIPVLTEFELDNANTIQAVRLPGRSHSLRARLFIDHLKREFGETAYWDANN